MKGWEYSHHAFLFLCLVAKTESKPGDEKKPSTLKTTGTAHTKPLITLYVEGSEYIYIYNAFIQ